MIIIGSLLQAWLILPAAGQEVMPEADSSSDIPDAAAVCLSNPTDLEIRYRSRWAFQSEWGDVEVLEPGRDRWYWWRFEPGEPQVSPEFYVLYDDHFDDGFTARTFVLDRYPVTLPGSCGAARKYWFAIEDRTIWLYSVN